MKVAALAFLKGLNDEQRTKTKFPVDASEWRRWANQHSLPRQGVSFEEMTEISKQHGMEMHKQQDAAHLQAMQKMGELMQKPEDMKDWFESKRKEFESLPED